jgi:hypothetical protein
MLKKRPDSSEIVHCLGIQCVQAVKSFTLTVQFTETW